MALTYHERADLATDSTFVVRVRQALIKYALYIAPTATGGSLNMAKSVLGAPDHWATVFAVAASENDFIGDGTAGDGSIDSEAGDTALSTVIEGQIWPAYAAEA